MKVQWFKTVDDILRHYGWGGEIRFVEVKKDEGKADGTKDVSDPGEDCEGERNTEQQSIESVPEELRKGG